MLETARPAPHKQHFLRWAGCLKMLSYPPFMIFMSILIMIMMIKYDKPVEYAIPVDLGVPYFQTNPYLFRCISYTFFFAKALVIHISKKTNR